MKMTSNDKIYNWNASSKIMIYRCKNCLSFFFMDVEMIDRLNNTMYVCPRCNNHNFNKYNSSVKL
jgi:hypothetical protein